MISRERYTQIPAAGVVSWNSYSDLRGYIEQIVVNPSSSTTSYDITITDDAGSIVYDKDGLMGTYTDDSKIGVYGIYTINITNASLSTNSFTVTLLWEDSI